jgi:hypothetical protein
LERRSSTTTHSQRYCETAEYIFLCIRNFLSLVIFPFSLPPFFLLLLPLKAPAFALSHSVFLYFTVPLPLPLFLVSLCLRPSLPIETVLPQSPPYCMMSLTPALLPSSCALELWSALPLSPPPLMFQPLFISSIICVLFDLSTRCLALLSSLTFLSIYGGPRRLYLALRPDMSVLFLIVDLPPLKGNDHVPWGALVY